MAKTMVISDEVWQELSKLKIAGKKKSLSDTLKELLEKSK